MQFKFSILGITLFVSAVVSAQWTNTFNGQGDFSDVFQASVADNAGNTYAAGYTINRDVSKDILLAKFNAAGDTVWTRQYAGTGNGPDEALAMLISTDGNIVITGYQKGAGTGFDFITQKYSTNGNLLWTSFYNYSTNESDQSNAITSDASGNIYIAGQSDKDVSPVNDDDYVVVKYNADGVQQWAKRSDGAIHSTDRPSAIAIGTDGNVIVTGRSNNGSDDDYLTIKYNSSTGNEMWRKLFDRTHHDRATDIAIDPSTGKIFVTGRSNNGTNYDYATLCYNTSGVEQWQAIFDYVDDDRATNIALDGSGNVYVAGQSDADASTVTINYNFLLVKYNSSGVQQFAQSWDGTAGDDDIPSNLIVDASGNSTITGNSDSDAGVAINNKIAAVRFNAGGVMQWAKTSTIAGSSSLSTSSAMDASGNIIVAGYAESIPNRDACVVKWNNAGVEQWTSTFNGIGDNGDNAHAIIRDNLNNTIVAGYTTSFDQDRNFLIMKISAGGTPVWTRSYNGTSTKQSTDDALSVAVDASNNIYAAGFLKNSGTGYDLLVMKLSTAGDSLWSYIYNDAASNETDKALSIQMSPSGNLVVCGRSDNDLTAVSDDDILVITLNTSGGVVWTARYQGTGGGDDIPRQMVVAPSGNIYVTGKTTSATDIDALLIKYNASGVQQWVRKTDIGVEDEFTAIQIDGEENVFVAGNTITATGNFDVITASFDASGNELFTTTYDHGENGNDEAKGLAIFDDGSFAVSCTLAPDTDAITLNGDIAAVYFDTNGNWQSTTLFDGGANDDASESAYASNTGFVICGQTDNGEAGNQDYDYITIYLDETGTITNTELYNGAAGGNDVANTLMLYDNGTYISGGSEGGQRDIVTILYGSNPVSISNNVASKNVQVYPNPTVATCTVYLDEINLSSSATLKLYGGNGNCVMQKAISSNDNIQLTLSTMPAGMYLLVITDGDQVYSTNLIKQ